jgi:hypothetical protein
VFSFCGMSLKLSDFFFTSDGIYVIVFPLDGKSDSAERYLHKCLERLKVIYLLFRIVFIFIIIFIYFLRVPSANAADPRGPSHCCDSGHTGG